jgi:hypothetical protein
LLAQAHTLDELFNNLASRAAKHGDLVKIDALLKIALKAQNQCRTTLETLASIKNPRVIFAKQANISNGHQQINNGTSAPASHAGEIINQPNELLEAQYGSKAMDTGTAGATIGKKRQWQPWNSSTGARTPEGKAVVSRNAFKGRIRARLRGMSALLRGQRECMRRVRQY